MICSGHGHLCLTGCGNSAPQQGSHTVSELKTNFPSIMRYNENILQKCVIRVIHVQCLVGKFALFFCMHSKQSTLSLCLIQEMHSNLFRYKQMPAAATLIQLLNSRQLITIAMFLVVNIKLATCVNPDVILLLQSANTKASTTLLLLLRLISANCTLQEAYLNYGVL